MKKYIAIGVVALLLAGAVYWSCALNSPEETGEPQVALNLEETDAGALETGTQGQTPVDYFESFRGERESARALEIQYLDEIIETSANDSETLEDAQAQKLALVENIEHEFAIENLIRAKGFADAAVTFHGGAVNVVVDCVELSNEQVAQILDIVIGETGVKAENVKIMPAGQ